MVVDTKKKSGSRFVIGVIFFLFVLFFLGMISLEFLKKSKKTETPSVVFYEVTTDSVIDYNKLHKSEKLSKLMKERKDKYNINDEVDVIVKQNETLLIGKEKIPMQEILDKLAFESGNTVEKDLTGDKETKKDQINEFGIYEVKPGDNLWNIHFGLLKNYFQHRGVKLSPKSDEPNMKSYSSGVGKLLKFSEKKTYTHIYDVVNHKIVTDIHIVEPKTKIVVYNMGEVYNLLERIDYSKVNEIQFDGETLWIPPEK